MTPLEIQMRRLGWDMEALVAYLVQVPPDRQRMAAQAREQQAKLAQYIIELERT